MSAASHSGREGDPFRGPWQEEQLLARHKGNYAFASASIEAPKRGSTLQNVEVWHEDLEHIVLCCKLEHLDLPMDTAVVLASRVGSSRQECWESYSLCSYHY